MRSSGDGGHNREDYGTPVSKKGPQSNRSPSQPGTDGMDRCFADTQAPQSYSDQALQQAAGYSSRVDGMKRGNVRSGSGPGYRTRGGKGFTNGQSKD